MQAELAGRLLNICFVGWADHVHLERWAGWFARAGHKVSVISFAGEGRYPAGVRQYRLNGRSVRWRRLKLAWLLYRIDPDLVHVHWATFAYDVMRTWRGPLVVTAWGSDLYRRAEQAPNTVQQLREGLCAAHVITCDSRDMVREIVEFSGVDATRVAVVQWGVDTGTFHHIADNAFARELGIEGRPVVFSARNFYPLYNQETVVAAFALVRRQCPQAVLLMKNHNGNPDYLKKISAQVKEMDLADAVRVVDTVPHERMAELYSMATVTVSVPSFDATPMALFEAMACGSVPVFSDLPSLREWLTDGSNGYLVPVRDEAVLADRILSVLRDAQLSAAIALRNQVLVKQEASQDANMGRMESICRQLVHSPQSHAS